MSILLFLACAGSPDEETEAVAPAEGDPIPTTAPEQTTVVGDDTGREPDTDEPAPEPVDTGTPPTIDCWLDVLSVESTVCFTWVSANALPPPEVVAMAPSRLVGYGMDSGVSCVTSTSPIEEVASVDLAIVDSSVLLCDNTGGQLRLTGFDLATRTTSVGTSCENGYALTGHDGGLAIDTPYYYEDYSWRTWLTLADAMAGLPGAPWGALPQAMHGGMSAAAEDGGIFYHLAWPSGEMSAWDLVADAPAAGFVSPQLPAAADLVTGMEVLDGVLYLVETDGVTFDLATYDPLTGGETSRQSIGVVANDAVYGFACMHP